MDYFPPTNGDLGDPNRPYVNGNPLAGIQGSRPNAKAIEGTMREILAVIDAAGIARDAEVFTQLLAAINVIVAAGASPDASETVKGRVELATSTEALGGTDTTRAVTSAGLASSKSLTTNGYMKFPGGLIIQWGLNAVVNDTNTAVTLPIAFPNAGLTGVCVPLQATPLPSPSINQVISVSTTAITLRQNGNMTVGWICLGR